MRARVTHRCAGISAYVMLPRLGDRAARMSSMATCRCRRDRVRDEFADLNIETNYRLRGFLPRVVKPYSRAPSSMRPFGEVLLERGPTFPPARSPPPAAVRPPAAPSRRQQPAPPWPGAAAPAPAVAGPSPPPRPPALRPSPLPQGLLCSAASSAGVMSDTVSHLAPVVTRRSLVVTRSDRNALEPVALLT